MPSSPNSCAAAKFATVLLLLFTVLFHHSPAPAQSTAFHNLPLATASGEQTLPITIAGASDEVFIFWEDQRGDEPAFFYQYLNPLNHPMLPTNGARVAKANGEQTNMSAVSDGAGGAIVVWQDLSRDDGDIFAQRLDRNGRQLWGESGKEVYRSGREQRLPLVVSDGANGAFIMWEDERGNSLDIYAQHLSAIGDKLWEAGGVAITRLARSQFLQDAAATPDRGFVVAWRDESSAPARIVVQRFDVAGNNLWSAPVAVALSIFEQSKARLLVDADNAGELLISVAWLERRLQHTNVFAQRLNTSGALLWGNAGIAVGRAAGNQEELQLLHNAGGDLIVVWEDERRDKADIFAQRVSRDGRLMWKDEGTPVIQANEEQTRPRLAADGQGGFFCVWEDERGTGNTIGVQRLDGNGSPQWKTDGIFLANHGRKTAQPHIVPRSGSRAFVVWSDTRRNNEEDIYSQPLAANGAFENVVPVIVSVPVVQAFVDVPYTYEVEAIDFDAAMPPTLKLIQAPSWLRINAGGSALVGTPGAGNLGESLVEVQALDAGGAFASQSFTLTVGRDPALPYFLSAPETLAVEDARYTYRARAADPDPQETLRYALENGGASWLNLAEQGELSGIPLNEHVGSYAIALTATNSRGKSAQQRFTLRVQNVNDPPFFITTPDTIAFVDSLYSYRPQAGDVDAGDRATISLLNAPAWLAWEAATQTLRGIPGITDTGTTQVTLRAGDSAGGSALQSFDMHVFNLGRPDQSAPGAPQNLTISPEEWNAGSRFTLRWENPFDPSGVGGAYYKIGALPAGNQDGFFVQAPASASLTEIQIRVATEGRLPVYLWLVDGKGNVDYKTAARIDYRYDATLPAAATNLAVRGPRDGKWINSDTLQFSWQAGSDAHSGIARYDLYLESRLALRAPGNATNALLDTTLSDGVRRWQLVAVDSAGNRSADASAFLQVDHTPPRVTHAPIDTAAVGQDLTITAKASDSFSGVAGMQLRFRAAGQFGFSTQMMSASGDEFSGTVAGASLSSPGFEYTLLAADSAGNVRSSAGTSARGVHAVVMKSEALVAPAMTHGRYYQIVSFPYRVLANTPAEIFADDFGNYDNTRWRLFAYLPDSGNVELDDSSAAKIDVGRAYWLVTDGPRSYDIGPAYSVSQTQDFVLTLQPGWNLIATPFDFPTDWAGVQRPPTVEAQLWAFDGRQYFAQQTEMQPWHGYFVRNLSSQPRTLIIPPRCQGCDPGLSKNTVDEISSQASWQMQLRVTDGEFSDTENWLGVSSAAKQEWDPLDLSEPPTALGKFVSLRFPQEDWREYRGPFTTDFRPPAAELQAWHFEIIAAEEGRALELDFILAGTLPENLEFILEDVSGKTCRALDFTAQSETTKPFKFRSGREPRRFILWAGSQEQLAAQGWGERLLPKQFELSPSFPNPARMRSDNTAVSALRFHLPMATEVRVEIFDILGRKVRTLAQHRNFTAGHHELLWDGKDETGASVSAGIYLYRLETPHFAASQKLVLIH